MSEWLNNNKKNASGIHFCRFSSLKQHVSDNVVLNVLLSKMLHIEHVAQMNQYVFSQLKLNRNLILSTICVRVYRHSSIACLQFQNKPILGLG